MARAKRRKNTDPSFRDIKKEEYYPVQRKFQLGTISAGPYVDATKFLNVSRALSEVNSRLYRTGRLYTMSVQLDNSAPAGDYEVWVLQNTWNVTKAFQAGLAAYNTAMAEERAEIVKGMQARWQDFTPANGVSSEQIGAFLGNTSLVSAARNDGEHYTTRVYDATGTLKEFSWSASSAGNRYSLMAEYDGMGSVDEAPQTAGAGGYVGMLADSDAAAVADLQAQGDNPPYANPNFATNIWVKVATLTNSSTGSQRLSTGMFEAPCGFVWIKSPTPTFADGQLTVEVKAGKYKGVHGASMGA